MKSIIVYKKQYIVVLAIVMSLTFNITAFASNSAGTLSFESEQINPNPQDEAELPGEISNYNTSNAESVINIANMVITWTGLLFTIIAIVFSVIGFLGYKEIGDLKKRERELNTLLEKTNQVLQNAKEAEKTVSNQVHDLTKEFKSNIDNVIQASYYYTIGTSKYKLGEHKEAIKFLEEALKYNPNNTEVICLIGKAYAHMGLIKTAERVYNSAVDIDPNCADAFRGIAALYRYTNKNESIKNAKKAVELAPNDPEILNYYGLLLMQDGQRDTALSYLLNAYRIKKHPDTAFFIGMIYIQEAIWDKASEYIDQAIAGYSEEETFGEYRELWRELSKWIKGMLPPLDDKKLADSLAHLKIINQIECSPRIRKAVYQHIQTVLSALPIEHDYVEQCETVYLCEI